ncbi:31965_t:CDS:2 [Racocetra persica]|uniref:31965_t:CDS:1 n=1 Tax=Racocetra persica TaxID=160502 RepID=A0ACA9KNP5_9GLOM|nr:31965_t:CDS:2 [Racocetra persica]
MISRPLNCVHLVNSNNKLFNIKLNEAISEICKLGKNQRHIGS